MEVFTAWTPTSSVNCKGFLETLQDEPHEALRVSRPCSPLPLEFTRAARHLHPF
jgi:hypothetical protein